MGGIAISNEEAILIKAEIYEGVLQGEISANHNTSQTTISRIMAGEQHYNAPWPDGSIGGLSADRRIIIRRLRFTQQKPSKKKTSRIIETSSTENGFDISKAMEEVTRKEEVQDEDTLIKELSDPGGPSINNRKQKKIEKQISWEALVKNHSHHPVVEQGKQDKEKRRFLCAIFEAISLETWNNPIEVNKLLFKAMNRRQYNAYVEPVSKS